MKLKKYFVFFLSLNLPYGDFIITSQKIEIFSFCLNDFKAFPNFFEVGGVKISLWPHVCSIDAVLNEI